MSQEKRFCNNCGATLLTDDRFCGSCGKQTGAAQTVSPPPASSPVPPPPPASSAELINGMIPAVSRKKGMLGTEGFNIIVTQKRMIFALMTNDLVKEEAKKAGNEGFLAGVLGAITAGYNVYKRYLNMSPEAALSENPQNFAVDLSRIKKIKLEPSKEIKNYFSMKDKSFLKQHQYENGKLEIETTGEKYSFSLPNYFYEMTEDTLRRAGLI